MIDLRLRETKDSLFDPTAARLAARVSPLALTLASLTVAIASAGLAWANLWLVALAAWWVSRILDGLDGPVARIRGTANDLGGYFDMVGDTVGYALIPLGVALGVDTQATWVALGALLAAFFINSISWSYLAAILEKRGAGAELRGEVTSITMPPALVEGAETIVLFSLFLAFPALASWIFAAMAALVTVNVLQRAVWAWRAL
jgi:phosphatidylglycerophosphate synthase